MSNGTVSSKSSGSDGSDSYKYEDTSIFTHSIPKGDRYKLRLHLDQNDVWEKAAIKMGFTENDINTKIKPLALENHYSNAEQLLSLWDDQNHTVTELFMVLYSIKHYEAMECLKHHVNRKYHRLLLKTLTIPNEAQKSRDSNESSSYYSDSMMSTNGCDNKKAGDVAGLIPFVLYEELETATENWSEKNILGRGGFATVFRGRWKSTEVAIKKIQYKTDDAKKKAKIQMKQMETELSFLNSCRHDNILPLYGYSKNGPEPCLVYQHMSGGSVERRLRGKTASPLTFEERNRIALGTARGLQYLHTYIDGKPLIHGDIKPANILLDLNCVPKIGDFGLVRQQSTESMKVSSICGTKPYLPFDYLHNRMLTTKIDTYSYGVVLFELYTTLRAYDKHRDAPFLAKFMRGKVINNEHFTLIDRSIHSAQCNPLYDFIMKMGMRCTDENCDNRPEMVKILQILESLMDKDGRSIGLPV
ncbi:serine/threonine-protein kinase pelle-like [Contarinia nasturtii]|uniref:serine/threonine-protein kinase pelle-like n=1 Tax=Contarinia nasturtii TaxID=265458 RepID=UPI0012D4823A|nr:serine/threonine-protein kinase pelle-like [Contarinia nasturtii]